MLTCCHPGEERWCDVTAVLRKQKHVTGPDLLFETGGSDGLGGTQAKQFDPWLQKKLQIVKNLPHRLVIEGINDTNCITLLSICAQTSLSEHLIYNNQRSVGDNHSGVPYHPYHVRYYMTWAIVGT